MNPYALWLALGWTMLHFLWVGGLIGIAAAIASVVLRRACGRGALRRGAREPGAARDRSPGDRLARSRASRDDRTSPLTHADQAPLALPRFVSGVDEGTSPVNWPKTAGAAPIAAAKPAATKPRPSSAESRLDAVAAQLPWIWLVGSPITFAWLALGLAGAERLRGAALLCPTAICRNYATGSLVTWASRATWPSRSASGWRRPCSLASRGQ